MKFTFQLFISHCEDNSWPSSGNSFYLSVLQTIRTFIFFPQFPFSLLCVSGTRNESLLASTAATFSVVSLQVIHEATHLFL